MKEKILFCDLIVQNGNEKLTLKKCVLKESKKEYYCKKLKKNFQILEKTNVKQVGFVHGLKSFSEAKKGEEKRNNITGAYE